MYGLNTVVVDHYHAIFAFFHTHNLSSHRGGTVE